MNKPTTIITMDHDSVYEKVFLNVSITDFLRGAVELLCVDYDFNGYDKEMIRELAAKSEPADRRFIWLCRNLGTIFCSEREVFIKDTYSHRNLLACATPFVSAYALLVEITDEADSNPIGNIYKLNLAEYAREIQASVILEKEHKSTFEDGYSMILPLGNTISWLRDHGCIISDEPIPESKAALLRVLKNHANRRKNCVELATETEE